MAVCLILIVIIPCVAGQFFEGTRIHLTEGRVYRVIIPCVAGQFFEEGVSFHEETKEEWKSSSPALRGSSLKHDRG